MPPLHADGGADPLGAGQRVEETVSWAYWSLVNVLAVHMSPELPPELVPWHLLVGRMAMPASGWSRSSSARGSR